MEAGSISHYKEFLIILGVSGLVVPLFLRIGINAVLAYLMVGILLSADVLGQLARIFSPLEALVIHHRESIAQMGELGVVFLLFLIGLELSFERLNTMRRLVFGLGGLQVLITLAAIAAILFAIGFDSATALVAGAALSLSSTAIVVQLLSDAKRLGSQTGRTSFAILLFQDLAVIPLLLLVTILGRKSDGSVLVSILTALAQAGVGDCRHRDRRTLCLAPPAPFRRGSPKLRSLHGGDAADRCRRRRGCHAGRPFDVAWRLHCRIAAGRDGVSAVPSKRSSNPSRGSCSAPSSCWSASTSILKDCSKIRCESSPRQQRSSFSRVSSFTASRGCSRSATWLPPRRHCCWGLAVNLPSSSSAARRPWVSSIPA